MKSRSKLDVILKRRSILMAAVSIFYVYFSFFTIALLYAQTENASTEEEKPQESTVQPSKLPKRSKSISLETLRMMEKIEIKTRELKKREEEIRIREDQLKTLEAKLKQDLQKIETALKKSKELMNVSTDLREENLNSLVKIYSAMRPDDAAPLVAALDEKIAIQILSRMKSKIAGKVMGKLETSAAKKLSEKIVGADIFGKDKE